MGFRTGSFATVFGVESKTQNVTSVRLAISKKDKNSNEYKTTFSGFVGFVGSVTAANALKLKEKDRIKLGDVDVTRVWDKTKQKEYINFTCYSFEMANFDNNNSNHQSVDSGEPRITEDSNGFMEVPDGIDEGELPF